MLSRFRIVPAIVALTAVATALAQGNEARQLTVKELMNEIITPATNTIWGAYQLQSDEEWAAVQQAATELLAAGTRLADGDLPEAERAVAASAEWRIFSAQMLEATRKVIAAIEARDEDAMSAAGNDELYPPCESCHRRFQAQ